MARHVIAIDNFFFKIETTQLVDVSQMANLDELARIAKAYHLKFTIIYTISGNLQNNDYQKKVSVRDEWALSAIL